MQAQNSALTIALTEGDVSSGTALDAELNSSLGEASRVPEGSDDWAPNHFGGAGLDHEPAADQPREKIEAWNTPGDPNRMAQDEEDPDPEPTDPEPTDPEPTDPDAVCEADFTLISEIQGEGQGTAIAGDEVNHNWSGRTAGNSGAGTL